LGLESDSDGLSLTFDEKESLQSLMDFHLELLKPREISDLAREVRGAIEQDCPEEDLMILESISLQL
jgi:hypothetical protein